MSSVSSGSAAPKDLKAEGGFHIVTRHPVDSTRLIKGSVQKTAHLLWAEPSRSVRLCKEIEPDLRPVLEKSRNGWSLQYVKGETASDMEIAVRMLEIYRETKRVVLDPISGRDPENGLQGNFIKGRISTDPTERVFAVDPDLAYRPDSPVSKNYFSEATRETIDASYRPHWRNYPATLKMRELLLEFQSSQQEEIPDLTPFLEFQFFLILAVFIPQYSQPQERKTYQQYETQLKQAKSLYQLIELLFQIKSFLNIHCLPNKKVEEALRRAEKSLPPLLYCKVSLQLALDYGQKCSSDEEQKAVLEWYRETRLQDKTTSTKTTTVSSTSPTVRASNLIRCLYHLERILTHQSSIWAWRGINEPEPYKKARPFLEKARKILTPRDLLPLSEVVLLKSPPSPCLTFAALLGMKKKQEDAASIASRTSSISISH